MSQYTVLVIADSHAHLGTNADSWPASITRKGKTYQFSSDLPLEGWMQGQYSNHAKYIRVSGDMPEHYTIIKKESK